MARGRHVVGGLLCAVGACLLSACALVPSSARDLSERIHHVELASHEAACLVAEYLAYEFTAATRDPLRARASAIDLGDGRYRVYYQSGQDAIYLPAANGYFERAASRGSPAQTPSLGIIRFVAQRSVSPGIGGYEHFLVEIDREAEHSSRLRIVASADGQGFNRRRAASIVCLVGVASEYSRALREQRKGNSDEALRCIARCRALQENAPSFAHDHLLARAQLLEARILLARGERDAARLAANRALLFAPDSLEVAVMRARISARFARSEDLGELLDSGSLAAPPGSGASRSLASAAREGGGLFAASKTDIEHGREALLREDFETAAAWANRALDAKPGNADALALLARALGRAGRPRRARDLGLLNLLTRAATPELVVEIARNEAQGGSSALGLRWILRYSEQFPHILAHPLTTELARRVGPEETSRALFAEGLGPAGLPTVLRWVGRADDLRQLYVGRLIAQSMLPESPDSSPPAAGEVVPSALESLPNGVGASGVRITEPESPPAGPPK